MTTIVYHKGVMAADRMVVAGTAGYSRMTKIHKVRGHLCGFSGSAYIGLSLLKWFADGADPATYPGNEDDNDSDACFMVVRPDGLITLYEGRGIPIEFDHDRHAIGSGAEFALGAMAMGADAKGAVDVAIQLDVFSGGGVDVLSLD